MEIKLGVGESLTVFAGGHKIEIGYEKGHDYRLDRNLWVFVYHGSLGYLGSLRIVTSPDRKRCKITDTFKEKDLRL